MGWVLKYIDEVGHSICASAQHERILSDPPSRYISVPNPYLFYYMSLPYIIKY